MVTQTPKKWPKKANQKLFHQKLQRKPRILFHTAVAQIKKLGQKSPRRTRLCELHPSCFHVPFPRYLLHCCRSSRRDRRLLLERLELSRQESFSTISNARSTNWIARKLLSADSNGTIEKTREGNDSTDDGITILWRPLRGLTFRLLLPPDIGAGQPTRWFDIIVAQNTNNIESISFHSPYGVNNESVWY